MLNLTPQTKAQLPDAIDIDFRAFEEESYDSAHVTYNKYGIVKEETTEKDSENYTGISGVGDFEETPGNDTAAETSRVQAFDKTLTPVRKTLNNGIDDHLIKTDQHGKIKNIAQAMGRAAKRYPDKRVAELFYRGILTTDSKGNAMVANDGVRNFSIYHKMNESDSTTWSNISASSITLTPDNLYTAKLALESQPNLLNTDLADVKARVLLVQPAQKKKAIQILHSQGEYGTANHDGNIFNELSKFGDEKLELVVWDRLGYASNKYSSAVDTYWWLLDPSMPNQMKILWNEKPHFVTGSPEYIRKQNYWEYTMQMFFAFGMVEPRGTYMSIGDGTTTVTA